jgi:hypothetical protein
MTHHSTVALPGNPDMSQYVKIRSSEKHLVYSTQSNRPIAGVARLLDSAIYSKDRKSLAIHHST